MRVSSASSLTKSDESSQRGEQDFRLHELPILLLLFAAPGPPPNPTQGQAMEAERSEKAVREQRCGAQSVWVCSWFQICSRYPQVRGIAIHERGC